ncbi:hypothetical protein TSAR_006353 [Trichomalopsis sarcophagae]|uniref:Uncharacterized protein n=1 Tax=Trichomalopsis sarcophagae TaxID=543379 RepID=A0A232FLE0_9HYME|nr:hypothetical protein TSAR_006353 [Trichomalopsis sarcophagae]
MNGENPIPGSTNSAPQSIEKRRPNKSRRPEGLLVKVGHDKTYAEALGKILKKVNPDTSRTMVLGVKQTRSGDVLLKLGRGSDKMAFTAEI